jgi:hypothetical protein
MAEIVTTTAQAVDSPTPPTNPYATPPADRWGARTAPPPAAPRPGVIEDRQWDALTPEQRDGYARVSKPGPDGGSEWMARDKLPSAADLAKPGSPGAGDGQASVTADGKLRVGQHELSPEDIAGLMERRAVEALRSTQVPEAYEGKLPEGYQAPHGLQFGINTKDAAFTDLQLIGKELGWTQDTFSKVLSVAISSDARKEATFQAAVAAEITKLGPNAMSRVQSVDTFLRSVVGDDLMKGGIRPLMYSAKSIEALEKIVHRVVSGGVASFRTDGREPAEMRGRASEAEYAAMTPAQRYTYSKGFPQSQFQR